jgi:hypothetical protein
MARRTRGGGTPARAPAPRATLLLHEKVVLQDESIMEVVLWRLPQPTPERPHGLKYRLYYGRHGVCLVRYDNETGKGDHKHVRGRETPYEFKSVEQLRSDFERDMKAVGGKHEKDT